LKTPGGQLWQTAIVDRIASWRRTGLGLVRKAWKTACVGEIQKRVGRQECEGGICCVFLYGICPLVLMGCRLK
jgi:hypothetical protein